VTKVGRGLTGHVAQTGQSYYTPDANDDPFAVTIQGTPDLDESILGVPLKYGDQVIGTIVLSKLGINQFDEEDRRLLESLASAAAVAFENARLFQMEHQAAEISGALLRLSKALTMVREEEAVLGEALRAVPALLQCAATGSWIREAATGDFHLITHEGFDPKFHPKLAGHVVPGEIVERLLLSHEEPFVLSKEMVASVPAEYRTRDEDTDVLVVPMRWEPEGLGVIVVVGKGSDPVFSERDVALARGIADITSMALGNARRFVELEQAYVSTVEALANAVEAKDEYTSDHCRALAEMSMLVGAEMGVSGDRLKILELGALFHDIGKIGVGSDIIRKPGALTPAERREMNLHPEIGARILAPVPFLQPVRPIVEASHERWDGKGYPKGLAGEEIPLESRIVFVCDAFHAMTTDRPYRAALPEKEAIRRLKLSAGTQFDSAVVGAFVRLHGDGRLHPH
jgi:HD-GYP domain-containing protein (c-di-GMP phosphodiesterase class II)